MNIFNRVVTVILLLTIAVTSIVSIVNLFVNLFEWADVLQRVLNYFSKISTPIGALILFALIVVSIVLLVFEFYRKKIKTASILKDGSGKAALTLKTIASEIQDELAKEKDLSDLKIKVKPISDGIVIDMLAKLGKDQNVPERVQQIRNQVSDFVSKKLGFNVIKINLTVTGLTPQKSEEAKKVEEAGVIEKESNEGKEEKSEDITCRDEEKQD